jgi:RimJ/RimL family protein N-acetyltransferase
VPSLEPIVLRGTVVQLEPLGHEHADALVRAADADRSSFGYTNVPADDAAMHSYIDTLLADAAAGAAVPLVQRRLADGTVVGCTRFMDIRWWAGHDTPVEVEIGGTWLTAEAQRTPINTEAKLLMLRHAFEVWRVHRVAICTDERNERSRRAIERIGGRFEGVLRNHRPAAGHLTDVGTPRNTAYYSILPTEWPAVREALEARLLAG